MRFSTFFTSATLCLSALASSSDSTRSGFSHANHIFNAIHSSLRQWGSSLNHNGMSFFIASVPEGTQFYHGRGNDQIVTGMEWLAFEPEHAMVFAREITGRPPERGKPPGNGKLGKDPDHAARGAREHSSRRLVTATEEIAQEKRMAEQDRRLQRHLQMQHPDLQAPLTVDDGPPGFKFSAGYLHTYIARKPLRLLYIDGMSAAKTSKGTLDSQDDALLDNPGPHQGFWDFERATRLCRLAEEEWDNSVDGFLRMESGFEVIMCDFARNMRAERITRARDPKIPGRDPVREQELFFAYYQAVATRYHGIGRDRAVLDYQRFVTAYTRDVDLWVAGDKPRLRGVSADTLAQIRKDVKELVMSEVMPTDPFDWQAITDKIVLRYASRLRNLLSPSLSTPKLLEKELERILQPFIDYDARNSTAETDRCTTQFVPKTTDSSALAAQVITSISHSICSTLSSALESTAQIDYETAIESIRDLISYLDWTAWKECRGCADDEICFVPMWPAGSVQDYESPGCTNASAVVGKRGYWEELDG